MKNKIKNKLFEKPWSHFSFPALDLKQLGMVKNFIITKFRLIKKEEWLVSQGRNGMGLTDRWRCKLGLLIAYSGSRNASKYNI